MQTLHGTSANFQGYVAYRRQSKQLIIAFSGTRTPSQALLDCHFFQRPHPIDPRCRVHRGFWRLYKGISKQALASLMKVSAEGYDVTELVITGHSMGGAVSYLLAIDLLSSPEVLPSGLVLKIAVFGAPRVGNRHLVEFWQTLTSTFRARRGQNALVEYAVKAYNDGSSLC